MKTKLKIILLYPIAVIVTIVMAVVKNQSPKEKLSKGFRFAKKMWNTWG